MIHYRPHIALVLTAVISLNVLAVPISYLNFRVSQDYYASVLCENPQKPITVCGGICYFKKQLPAPEENQPVSFVSQIDVAIFYQVVALWSFQTNVAYVTVWPPYSEDATVSAPASLFHPPRS